MMLNLLNQVDRLNLIRQIKTSNNIERKNESVKQSNIVSGKIKQYVIDDLRKQFFEQSIREMPVISSINIAKRIVEQKSSIYKKEPNREFIKVTDVQKETLNLIYKDMKINSRMNHANKNLNTQDQTFLMCLPKDGKLILRNLKLHQLDVIPEANDPETAFAYIVSAYDKEDVEHDMFDRLQAATGVTPKSETNLGVYIQDGKLDIANEMDYKKIADRYVVWTKELNFIMNGHGEILDPETGEVNNAVDISSPLKEYGIMPFVDVSRVKEFEFFVNVDSNKTDFTVEFNTALSDLSNVCKMNGYAVGVLKAPSSMQPENMVVGATMLLKLNTDNADSEVDFKFTNPSSNISEISDAVDKRLNYFITTEGLDSSAVNAQGQSKTYSSGTERFLSMIQKAEASQEDFELMKEAENQLYQIITAWCNVLTGTETLDKKYHTGKLNLESEMKISYQRPEIVQTEQEKFEFYNAQIERGFESKVSSLVKMNNWTREEALAYLKQVNDDEKMINQLMLPSTNDGMEDDNGDQKLN
jgi:hypothetical protein